MAFENLRGMHPTVKDAVKEIQGLRVDLVAGAAADVNSAVAEIKEEDTLVSAINNNGGALTVVDVSTLTIADGYARGSATLAVVIATDALVVNGLTYTGVAGVKADNTQFSVDTSDAAAAIDLADSINDRDGATVTAVANGTTVELTAVAEGAAGNSITLSTPDVTITVSGATLVNGTGVKSTGTLTVASPVAGEQVTVDGQVYTAVLAADAQTAKFNEYAIGASDTITAANLRDAINGNEKRPGRGGDVVATSAGAVVTITAVFFGTGGNSIGLAGSAGVTASGANLTGGLPVGGAIRAASAFNQLMLTWFNKR